MRSSYKQKLAVLPGIFSSPIHSETKPQAIMASSSSADIYSRCPRIRGHQKSSSNYRISERIGLIHGRILYMKGSLSHAYILLACPQSVTFSGGQRNYSLLPNPRLACSNYYLDQIGNRTPQAALRLLFCASYLPLKGHLKWRS